MWATSSDVLATSPRDQTSACSSCCIVWLSGSGKERWWKQGTCGKSLELLSARMTRARLADCGVGLGDNVQTLSDMVNGTVSHARKSMARKSENQIIPDLLRTYSVLLSPFDLAQWQWLFSYACVVIVVEK